MKIWTQTYKNNIKLYSKVIGQLMKFFFKEDQLCLEHYIPHGLIKGVHSN